MSISPNPNNALGTLSIFRSVNGSVQKTSRMLYVKTSRMLYVKYNIKNVVCKNTTSRML